MKRIQNLIVLLIATALLGKVTIANESQNITIIFAAEMPDISNPNSGKYAELQKLITDTKRSKTEAFFLFGGGSIGPSALSNLDRGSHIVDILNSLEPDAMGIAKREFSYFEDELSLRSYEAAFPFVSSNIIDTRIDALPDGIASNALITKGKTKLGFISIVSERLIDEYLLKNIKVIDPIKATKAQSKILKEAGADIVIVHYFYPYSFISELLQNNVIDFAFISNTLLPPSEIAKIAKQARIFSIDSPGNALVAEISIAESPKVISAERILLSNIASDPSVRSQVNEYQMRLDRLLDDRIGIWDGEFSTKRDVVRGSENAFVNYIVDTMRSIADADIALINAGSIRGDRTYKKNTSITRKTIANELPFRPTLSIISIKGSDLLAALEVGFAGLDERRGSFPQVSGMRIRFDSKSPHGKRIKSVKINDQDIDIEKHYVLATTDYLVNGGDGYSSLSKGEALKSSSISGNILISDLIQRDISLQGKLTSTVDNRLLDISSGNSL
ncbi:MAG: 5'-nucleotidase/UDP-sugar diphosphatase [Glaciecola sp.]|jgi:5'-nucleotidase/UDP-sugar diphosphatase